MSTSTRNRLTDANRTRGSTRPRRREHVWLVMPPTPDLENVGAHQVTGALALEQRQDLRQSQAPRQITLAQRCTLVVDRDPALAQRLKNALSARYAPRYSVGLVNSSTPFASFTLGAALDVLVFDANMPEGSTDAGYVFSGTSPDQDSAKIIYISRDTSFDLNQRGVTSGALVRPSARLNETLELVAALID